MCGIIACRTHAPAVDYLLVALGRLEYRGYDSVGVAVQTTKGDVVRLRTVGRLPRATHIRTPTALVESVSYTTE
jgi:glucosamine--fructose-6-phosphate aminotransferase (isomerizing)